MPAAPISKGYPFSLTTPVLANFTQVLQSTATVSTVGNSIHLKDATGHTGPWVSQLVRSFATNKQAEIGFDWGNSNSVTCYAGIGFRESGTGKLFYFWLTTAAGQSPFIYATSFTSPTSGQTNPASDNMGSEVWTGGFAFIRVKYDGTNLLAWWGDGNLQFGTKLIPGSTFAASSYFTTAPDQISIAINMDATVTSGTDVDMSIVHYAES